MTLTDPHRDTRLTPQDLARAAWGALTVGLLAGLASLLGAFRTPDGWHAFLVAYLFAYLFWLGIALGSMAWMMIHQLTGGAWGFALRRAALAATLTLPLLVLLFIPILLGVRHLYVWADPATVHAYVALQHKHAYLNLSFWTVRAAAYFFLWITLASLLNRWLRRFEQTREQFILVRLQRLSAGGLLAIELTMSLAAVDWIMSRDVAWHSTIFGFLVTVGQALAALAFLILATALLAGWRPGRTTVGGLEKNVLIDLGNLLLTSVVLWSYLAFAQLLVIWLGNKRDEIVWYTQRGIGQEATVWRWVGASLMLFHFLLPFFLLLFRDLKRRVGLLVGIALLLLLMRLVDGYWMIAPAGTNIGPVWRLSYLDFLLPLALGGLWIAWFAWMLQRRPVAEIP